MASRRLLSSLLRSPLTRSSPEFHVPASARPFASPRSSPIASRIFPPTEAFSRFELANGLALEHGTHGVSSFRQAAALVPPFCRIKFKRLDKTARHIMQILDKEAVEETRAQREIPDIKPGYIVQLKVEVPENKRRVSIIKGIVIARRNDGFNTTFGIRRLVAGVGVVYSPNIKEIKVLDKKKVRRAKLYYLREKMNALKN